MSADASVSPGRHRPLRIGVIGAGYFARFQHEAWARLPDAELVAICDQDMSRARAAAGDGIATFSDIATMLGETDLDLVDIATPPQTHLDLVRAATGRGLPVICQKPLAPTYDEAIAVVETAENAGTLLVAHENFRFQPWFREAKRLIDEGWLGTLHSIAFRMRPGDGQGPRAYLDRQPYFQQMPRFLVHETAIHFIDTFRFLMGEVAAVTAQLRRINPAIQGEDAGYILFDFAAGTTGLFDGNRLNDHSADNTRRTMGEMWLEGENGVLRLDGMGRLWWKPHGETEGEHRYDWTDSGFAGDCVHALQKHVLAHLRDGAALENTGRAYLRNIAIEEAVYRSADEHRRISF